MLNKISKGLFDRHVIPTSQVSCLPVIPTAPMQELTEANWSTTLIMQAHIRYPYEIHCEIPNSRSSMTIKATAIRRSCTFIL